MRKPALRLCSIVILFIFVFLSSGLAEAALSARDEKKAGAASASAPAAAAPKKATGAPSGTVQKPAPSRATTPKDTAVQQEAGVHIPGTYIKAMQKEHEKFAKAFIDAEMGLRHYIKLDIDGTKLTDTQRQALIQELQGRLKTLETSAGRYARNIRDARIAYEKMNQEERTLFAAMLSSLFAVPAWAAEQGVVDVLGTFEAEISTVGVAAGTAQLDYSAKPGLLEKAWNSFAASYAGQVMAAGMQLGAAVGGTIVGAALTVTAIMSAPATAAGAVLVGLGIAAFGTGLIGGLLGTVAATDDFVKAVRDDTTGGMKAELREGVDNLGKKVTGVNLVVNAPGLATSGSKAELLQGVLSTISDAMNLWGEALEKASDAKVEGILKSTVRQPTRLHPPIKGSDQSVAKQMLTHNSFRNPIPKNIRAGLDWISRGLTPKEAAMRELKIPIHEKPEDIGVADVYSDDPKISDEEARANARERRWKSYQKLLKERQTEIDNLAGDYEAEMEKARSGTWKGYVRDEPVERGNGGGHH